MFNSNGVPYIELLKGEVKFKTRAGNGDRVEISSEDPNNQSEQETSTDFVKFLLA